MQTRGAIHSPDRARQLRDFSGLRYEKITPTDIDGIIEYKNIGYVILELKFADNELPYGQKLALERITDDLEKSGKRCLCIIARHYIENPSDYIDVANSRVDSYRHKGKWHSVDEPQLVKEIISNFLKHIG